MVKGYVTAVVVCTMAGCLLVASTTPAAVVSVGDSYSSGEGAGPFDEGTNLAGGCHRSAKAWPRLLGVIAQNHLACSGATTLRLARPESRIPGSADAVSQLDRLRAINAAAPVEQVLMTIGGNDLRFARIIRDCVIKTCLKRMSKVELPRLRNVVRPRVANAIRSVRAAAPAADIVIVGYPNLIPAAGKPLRKCGWLTAAEKLRVRRLQRALHDTLASAAGAARASYAEVRLALEGHELCTRESWVRPVATTRVPLQQQAHPDARGQVAIATGVRNVLARRAGQAAAERLYGQLAASPGLTDCQAMPVPGEEVDGISYDGLQCRVAAQSAVEARFWAYATPGQAARALDLDANSPYAGERTIVTEPFPCDPSLRWTSAERSGRLECSVYDDGYVPHLYWTVDGVPVLATMLVPDGRVDGEQVGDETQLDLLRDAWITIGAPAGPGMR